MKLEFETCHFGLCVVCLGVYINLSVFRLRFVQELATITLATEQQNLFSNYFKSNTWIDVFATGVMNRAKVWSTTTDGARAEAIEKTVLNALLSHSALTHLATAISMVRVGRECCTSLSVDKTKWCMFSLFEMTCLVMFYHQNAWRSLR